MDPVRQQVGAAGATVVVGAALGTAINYATSNLGTPFAWVAVGVLVALATVIAVVTVRIQIAAQWRPDRLAAAAELLAGQVRVQWDREMRVRLLADPGPMPVRWRPTRRPVVDRTMTSPARTGPGQIPVSAAVPPALLPRVVRGDDVAALARAFGTLPRRRLVLLGGPGSGKSTLAAALLLELLRTREAGGPVPVLLTLTGWDIAAQPELWDWLAERIAEDYPALRAESADAARLLVQRRGVLPVLDGLDEIPATYRPAVLAALNRSLGPDDALVLSCRSADYQDTVARGDALTGAAVLEADPLDQHDAATYLDACLPPARIETWAPILDALREGKAPALAGVCQTPLGLWLVRTVYVESHASGDTERRAEDHPDPVSLVDPTTAPDPATLQNALFEQLVPTVLEQDHHRGSVTTARRPEDVRHWLATLATMMNAAGTRDLRWWRLRRYPRVQRSRWRRLCPPIGALTGLVLATGVTSSAFSVLAGTAMISNYVYNDATSVVYAAADNPTIIEMDGPTASSLGNHTTGFITLVVIGAGLPVLMGVMAGTVLGVQAIQRSTPRITPLGWTLGALGAFAGTAIAPLATMVIIEITIDPFINKVPFDFITVARDATTLGGGLVGLVLGVRIGVRNARYGWRTVPYRADLRPHGRLGALVRALLPGTVAGLVLVAARVPALIEVHEHPDDAGNILKSLGLLASLNWQDVVLTDTLLILVPTLLYGLARGLRVWAQQSSPLDAAETPHDTLRQDRAFTLLRTGAWVTLFALVALWLPLDTADPHAVVDFLPVLITSTMAGGVCLLARNAWFGYAAVVTRAAATGHLPRRLMPFLDDMHRLGLLRTVGATYQFRHAEFQDHLAATCTSSASVPPERPFLALGSTAGDGGGAIRPQTDYMS